MYLKETVWEAVEWIHLAQDRNRWHAAVSKTTYPRISGGNFSTR